MGKEKPKASLASIEDFKLAVLMPRATDRFVWKKFLGLEINSEQDRDEVIGILDRHRPALAYKAERILKLRTKKDKS